MWQYNYTDELYHYGVPGMRWGVRRKQVTPSADHTEARAIRKKSVKEMTNQELKKANERMNLESNYYKNRDQVNTGKRVVRGFIAGGLLAAGVVTAVAAYSKLGKNAFKGMSTTFKSAQVIKQANKSGTTKFFINSARGKGVKKVPLRKVTRAAMNYIKAGVKSRS